MISGNGEISILFCIMMYSDIYFPCRQRRRKGRPHHHRDNRTRRDREERRNEAFAVQMESLVSSYLNWSYQVRECVRGSQLADFKDSDPTSGISIKVVDVFGACSCVSLCTQFLIGPTGSRSPGDSQRSLVRCLCCLHIPATWLSALLSNFPYCRYYHRCFGLFPGYPLSQSSHVCAVICEDIV